MRGLSRRGASSVGREPALSVGLLVFTALLAPSLAFSQPSEETAAPASSDEIFDLLGDADLFSTSTTTPAPA